MSEGQTVFVVIEPRYHSNQVFAVCSTLTLAKTAVLEAVAISPSVFRELNPAYWWTYELRAGGIVVHQLSGCDETQTAGWAIEEHVIEAK